MKLQLFFCIRSFGNKKLSVAFQQWDKIIFEEEFKKNYGMLPFKTSFWSKEIEKKMLLFMFHQEGVSSTMTKVKIAKDIHLQM